MTTKVDWNKLDPTGDTRKRLGVDTVQTYIDMWKAGYDMPTCQCRDTLSVMVSGVPTCAKCNRVQVR